MLQPLHGSDATLHEIMQFAAADALAAAATKKPAECVLHMSVKGTPKHTACMCPSTPSVNTLQTCS
jgi:hypothetical protein